MRGMRVLDLGYEGIISGVEGYYIRGRRVSDPGEESIKFGGTRVSDPWCKGIISGVQWYYIRGTRVSDSRYEGFISGVRGYNGGG